MLLSLPNNKKSDEIGNEIVGFTNSIETSESNVVISTIVSRKDTFNNKGKEVNENVKHKWEKHKKYITVHTASNINSFRHTDAKGLHLNNYGDKQLDRNFTSFVKNG